jgi:hypothetical protein
MCWRVRPGLEEQRCAPYVSIKLLVDGSNTRAIKVTLNLVSAKIDYRKAVNTLNGTISDVGDAFARSCQTGLQIEAHVLQVRVWEDDVRFEDDSVEDSGIPREVNSNEFWTTRDRGGDQVTLGSECAACVKNLGSIQCIHDD